MKLGFHFRRGNVLAKELVVAGVVGVSVQEVLCYAVRRWNKQGRINPFILKELKEQSLNLTMRGPPRCSVLGYSNNVYLKSDTYYRVAIQFCLTLVLKSSICTFQGRVSCPTLAIDWQSCVSPLFIHCGREYSHTELRSSVLGTLSYFCSSLSRAVSSLIVNMCSFPSEYAATGSPEPCGFNYSQKAV